MIAARLSFGGAGAATGCRLLLEKIGHASVPNGSTDFIRSGLTSTVERRPYAAGGGMIISSWCAWIAAWCARAARSRARMRACSLDDSFEANERPTQPSSEAVNGKWAAV